MRAKPEYRDRDETEVAVLDALADRREEGMTVFELRTRVDAEIDRLEDALAELNADDLIEVSDDGERTVIVPDDAVVGSEDAENSQSFLSELFERIGL